MAKKKNPMADHVPAVTTGLKGFPFIYFHRAGSSSRMGKRAGLQASFLLSQLPGELLHRLSSSHGHLRRPGLLRAGTVPSLCSARTLIRLQERRPAKRKEKVMPVLCPGGLPHQGASRKVGRAARMPELQRYSCYGSGPRFPYFPQAAPEQRSFGTVRLGLGQEKGAQRLKKSLVEYFSWLSPRGPGPRYHSGDCGAELWVPDAESPKSLYGPGPMWYPAESRKLLGENVRSGQSARLLH